jgi:hypothetical protein
MFSFRFRRSTSLPSNNLNEDGAFTEVYDWSERSEKKDKLFSKQLKRIQVSLASNLDKLRFIYQITDSSFHPVG